jgi:hypothetical protein
MDDEAYKQLADEAYADMMFPIIQAVSSKE